jgi:hypothetical protein
MCSAASLAEGFAVWVVYERPSDFPQHFVLRKQVVCSEGHTHPEAVCKVARSLQEIRTMVPPGRVCLQRMLEDDPVIVETWV